MEDLVEVVGEGRWSNASFAAVSREFRKYMLNRVPGRLFRESILGGARPYRTRFNEGSQSRATLSDKPSEGVEDHQRYPLGAMPHETITQLRERQIDRMTTDVVRLRDGCLAEMRFWREVRRKLNAAAASYEPTEEERELTKKFLLGTFNRKDMSKLLQCPIQSIVSAIVRFANEVGFPRHPEQLAHHGVGDVVKRIIDFLGISKDRLEGVRNKQLFFLTRSVTTKELVAAFFPLLIHSRQNTDPLRELTRSRITFEKGIYTVRGFKSKTDQELPLIDITAENVAAFEAMELLIWNFERLKQFKHITASEERLWFSWDHTSNERLSHPMTNFSSPKALLLKQLSIDWFSEEQIRVHMLTLDRLKDRSNIHAVRDEAGHASLNTTAGYFENLASLRQSTSINLEFQRRIDSTIKFQISKENRFFADKFDERYVDQNLLFPIGDGTSCTNPFEPPDPAWLLDGACDARNCHAGSGCLKNKILIGKKRAIEVWATSIYYAGRWKQLIAENEDAFLKWHGPSMLFNLVLKNYIRNSIHWLDIEPSVRTYDASENR
ncbi:hypothetical protein [Paraburkholderia diazotrophica]|uniref:hypothetical protein n=1 Tax=Paraburkholderia diazotrophica TaxID=667676 RepID=UPI00317D0B91